MSTFRCTNKDCENYMKPVEVFTFNWPYEHPEKRKQDTTCQCGSKMECLPYEKEKTVMIATFDSKSPTEKKQILKKRENDEFKRNREMRERVVSADRGEV